MSSMVIEGIGWTIANSENLSMDVRKYFVSVEKMSMCNISPTWDGIGVSPSSCFLGCFAVSDDFAS